MQIRHLALMSFAFAFAGQAHAADAVSDAGTNDAATVLAALNAAAPAKLAVSETYAKTHVWAESNETAGYEAPADAQATVEVGAAGVITIGFAGGGAITLTPASGGGSMVRWSCASSGLDPGVVPEVCR
jgi:hypothetical protein